MSAASEADVSGPVAMITGPRRRVGKRRHLLADGRDQRMRFDRRGDPAGEPLAIHGERGAGGHTRRVGDAHDERAEPAHLLFQQADRVIELVAAEGVAADELGEAVGLVHRGRTTGRIS